MWITHSPKTPSSRNPSKPSEYDPHQQNLTQNPVEASRIPVSEKLNSLVSISRNRYSTPISNTREKSHVSPLPPPAGPMLRLLIIPFSRGTFSLGSDPLAFSVDWRFQPSFSAWFECGILLVCSHRHKASPEALFSAIRRHSLNPTILSYHLSPYPILRLLSSTRVIRRWNGSGG